jgi:FAD:protein FMN transferase
MRRVVMGMPVEILGGRAPGAAGDGGGGGGAPDAAFAWLEWVDATFSTYRRDSEVSRIGRGELEPAEAHPHVRAVIASCAELREATRGYFDAGEGAAFDPSGLVKGWAVDHALDRLDGPACINAGGDVLVRGGPWRVGIRHPRRRRRLAGVVALTDAAIATSGGYERGGHIRDPRTGRPARGVLSVSVIGPRLATADAYATAAFAMGAAGPAWTTGLDGHDAMTILPGGRVLSTPGFVAHCPGGSVAASIQACAA